MNRFAGMMGRSPSASEPSSPWNIFRSSGSSQRSEPQQKVPAPLTVALARSIEAALVELATKHLKTEGLFRVSASVGDVKDLVEDMSDGSADAQTFHNLDEHVLANAIKKSLHQHEPLIPADWYDELLEPSPDYLVLFRRCPSLNKRILSALFAFFAMLIEESSSNRMDADAIARSIGEMLLRPPEDEDMSDLEAIQHRLKATRSVFHFLLDNRTTVLPPETSIRKLTEEKEDGKTYQSEDELPASNNSFDDDDWNDITSARLLANPKRRESPVAGIIKQTGEQPSIDGLPDDNVSEIGEVEERHSRSTHGTSDDHDTDNEISRITEGSASAASKESPLRSPQPISVKARVAEREEKDQKLIAPLPIPLPLAVPSAASRHQSDEDGMTASQGMPTPGPALTQAQSPKIGRGSSREKNSPVGAVEAPTHDSSDIQSPVKPPILKQAKSADGPPASRFKQLIGSATKLEASTPMTFSQPTSPMKFSSAVFAMRASQKLRKTQEGLGFSENFKPRPKTEFGTHAGVILEGWLDKKQTSSPGLWNKRYVVLYDDLNVRFYGKARKSAWGMLPLDVRNRIPLTMISRVVSDARANNGRQFDIICEWPADTEDGRVLFNGPGWEKHKEREKGDRKQTNTASKVFHLRAATSEERLLWVTVLEQSLKQAGGVSTLRASTNRPPLPPRSYSMGAHLSDRDQDQADMKSDEGSVRSESDSKVKPRRSFNFPFGNRRATDSGDELPDDQQSVGSGNSDVRASRSKGWRRALSLKSRSPERLSH